MRRGPHSCIAPAHRAGIVRLANNGGNLRDLAEQLNWCKLQNGVHMDSKRCGKSETTLLT